VAEEVFRLGKGGNGDAGGAGLRIGHREASDVDGLRGFHVRAQGDTVPADGARHGVEVALQDAAVQHQARCRQVVELHSDTPSSSAMRGVAFRPLPVSTSTVV
jgi:hypothetical protein